MACCLKAPSHYLNQCSDFNDLVPFTPTRWQQLYWHWFRSTFPILAETLTYNVAHLSHETRSNALKHLDFHNQLLTLYSPRPDSRFAPSQWETLLQSNAVSHCVGANLESALHPALFWWKIGTFWMKKLVNSSDSKKSGGVILNHLGSLQWVLAVAIQRCGSNF